MRKGNNIIQTDNFYPKIIFGLAEDSFTLPTAISSCFVFIFLYSLLQGFTKISHVPHETNKQTKNPHYIFSVL